MCNFGSFIFSLAFLIEEKKDLTIKADVFSGRNWGKLLNRRFDVSFNRLRHSEKKLKNISKFVSYSSFVKTEISWRRDSGWKAKKEVNFWSGIL